MSTEVKAVVTFQAASAAVQEFGVLPLSSFIPDHPSLESITTKESWHTGLETDPWLWRDRFAGEGVAAYGRFFAKKPILISAALFPLFKLAFGETRSVEERYAAGLVSKAVVELYRAIEANPGIDVKSLKKQVGMQEKERKSEFDRALIDLQASFEVVILGISERLNEFGNKNGWNSTCYIMADRWLELQGQSLPELSMTEAQEALFAQLEQQVSPGAFTYLQKVLRKR
ncbi:hypothetical protein [Tumebacillus lipolyticus]|uniref:Uncharacterized protein n=1 Tax=Tumebacillus lipolyticus TaxID=1280370 RepID=A0ABW5A1V4_9BACL